MIRDKKLVNLGCGAHFHKDWINLDLHSSEFVQYHNIKNKLPFEDDSIDAVYHSHVLEHLSKKDGLKLLKECFRVLKKGGILRLCVPDLEQICREYLLNLEKSYSTNDPEETKKYLWNKLEIFDQIMRKQSGGEMVQVIQKNLVNKEYVIKRNGDEFIPFFNSSVKKESAPIKIMKKIYHMIFSYKNNPQTSGESHKWMYDKLDLKLSLEQAGFNNFTVANFNSSKIPNWNSFNLDNSENDNRARKPDSIFVETVK